MKRCPECRRDYYDDTLSFCLDDGSELLFGPAISDSSVSAGGLFDDGPQTAILHDTASQPEAATKARRFATDQTAVLPSDITEQPRPKSYDKRLLFAPIALALVVLGGFLGYGYFSTGDQINSIAVLPFENSGGNPDSEYISDGLAESLIFRLSQLPDLKVSPRSSVFRYKGQMIDAELVGKELGVDAVMSGRIIQRGDSFTISVDLVDVRNRKTLWGEQFERKMSELLTTQREISAEIASKLRLQLSDDGERKLAKKYTDNNEAFQLYLQGRFQFAKRSKESLLDSIASYQRAIDADPKFALAHAAIADSYNSLAKNPDAAPSESVPMAKAAALRALELDPELSEAHAALADSLAIYDWNWQASEYHLKRAIELNPNLAYTRVVYAASLLSPLGRTPEAVAELERAVELEPAAPINNAILSAAYLYNREFGKAVEQGKKTVALDPNFAIGYLWLVQAYVAADRVADAESVNVEVMRRFGPIEQSAPRRFMEALVRAKAGDRTEALDHLQKLKELEKTKYVRPLWSAAIYAALGDKEAAFAELDRAERERDAFLPRVKPDPIFDPLREDPRFKELLKRMNLPE